MNKKMKEYDAKKFEAEVSQACKMFGQFKGESDPNFDFETYINEKQETSQKRVSLLNELAPALMEKFSIDRSEVERLLSETPYMPDLWKAGIDFSEAEARRLATELLSDTPAALAVLNTKQKEWLAYEELIAVGAQEIRRLMSEAGIDPNTFNMTDPFLEEWSAFYDASQETQNHKLALADAFIQSEKYAKAFRSWLTQDKDAPKKKLSPRSRELSAGIRFTGDNVHRATVAAFSCPSKWRDGEGENYFKEFSQEMANLKIDIRLPNGEKAASIWEFIQRGGAAMVKAHYALWARYYEQVDDGFELQDVVVNINDFCRDLGYSKHKGAYKPEAKRRAMQLLEALTTAEMSATYQVQGTKKGHTKTRRLKGTLWRRGLEAEEKDTYEDLLGNARAGNPEEWVPSSFSFSPGAWYADKEWRRYNKYIGKIGAGLMQLRVDRDEWAILIGGYLGTLARTGQYRPRRLKTGTILKNTGLDKAIGYRQKQFQDKFYRALDRLTEEHVIAAWKTEGFDDSDVDQEDSDALGEYGAADPFPPGDWRGHIVEFTFDFAADMHRLETRKIKAITAKTKRAKKETAPKTPPHAV